MPKAEYVKALVRAHSEGDDERFYSVAIQAAAQAARQGHAKFAQELRDLVDQARERGNVRSQGLQTKPVQFCQPRGELAGLLAASYPGTRLSEMVLADGVRDMLERVLLEQRRRGALRESGFTPISKLLLVGPPGTGKTMTASAIAGELGLPLFTIQLDNLITKYLGETAAKLRLIFDLTRDRRGVYLFDEFDALGGDRAARNEVGEVRRVLSSFLQFIETDDSDSVIITATNYPQLLDHALFRRFDFVIEYPVPSKAIAEQLLRARLALLDSSGIDWVQVVECTAGLSHADITRACDYVAKNAFLDQRKSVITSEVLKALEERKRTDRLGR